MPLLLLLLIVVPLVELYVIIQVGQAIGILWTIALLLADSVLGGLLMRSQGRRAWRRFTTTMSAGRVPAKETLDGALVIFGGAFLMTPGFVTDIFGFALLAPPSRAAIRSLLLRRFSAGLGFKVRGGSAAGGGPFAGDGTFAGGGPFAGRRGAPSRGDADVEGTAIEVDARELPPERR